MRIFFDNLIDDSDTVLTASSEAAALPVENLAEWFLKKVWRTGTAATAESVTIDLGSSKELSSIIIVGHNLEAGDNLRYMLSDAADFAGADEITMDWREGSIVAVFAAVEVRYLKILFDKPTAGETRQIGRMFVGKCYDLDELPDGKGYKEDPKDLSKVSRAISGQKYTEVRPSYNTYKISGSQMPQDQVEVLYALNDACGTHTPFFVQIQDELADLQEEPLDDVLYVTLKDLVPRDVEGVTRTLRWKVSLELEQFI